MVTTYNEAWRGEAAPLDADQLARRLELARIGFGADASMLLSYAAGDLFGGHVVDALLDPARTVSRAVLVG
jgi:hypothetical protein